MDRNDRNKTPKNGPLIKFLIVFGPFAFIAILCFFEIQR